MTKMMEMMTYDTYATCRVTFLVRLVEVVMLCLGWISTV